MKKVILAMLMACLMLVTIFSAMSVNATFKESTEVIIVNNNNNDNPERCDSLEMTEKLTLGDGDDNPQNIVRTIYVDDDNTDGPWDGTFENPFQYIQDGIDAADDGDIVYVFNGLYSEEIVWEDKSINLIGEDKNTTIIEGGGDYNQFKITDADSVTLRGFTIKNILGGGIWLDRSSNCIIHDNILKDCESNAIYIDNSSGNTISENTITSENLNYNGIVLMNHSSNNYVYKNNINNSLISGIWLLDSSHNVISNNIIKDIIGFTFFVHYQDFGIRLDSSCDNTISENIIINDKGSAVILFETNSEGSNYNVISGNNFTGCENAISMEKVNNNIILENNITNNNYGINATGLGIFGNKNNLFYHNNFIDNNISAYDQSIFNTWYNPTLKEGNYWDDYEGEDNEPPYGIGDTPYGIKPRPLINKDYRPLMNPYSANRPPKKPNKPSGPSSGKAGEEYTYTAVTTDPDGDWIYYLWDWDDGTYNDWMGPYNSGETCEATHSWSAKGTYQVKVKAKDVYGAESPWSDPLSATMPVVHEPEELTAKLAVSRTTITRSNCWVTFDASGSTPKLGSGISLSKIPWKIRWDFDGGIWDTEWKSFFFYNYIRKDMSYLFNNNGGTNTPTTGPGLPGLDSDQIAGKYYYARVEIKNMLGETSRVSKLIYVDYTSNDGNNDNNDILKETIVEEQLETTDEQTNTNENENTLVETIITTPTEPINPEVPNEPVTPTPVTPAPVTPVNPVDPVDPIDPVYPTPTPVNPEEPELTEPTETIQPEVPNKPVTPEELEPIAPTKPENTDTTKSNILLVTPEETDPVEPVVVPEKPEIPVSPTEPASSTSSDISSTRSISILPGLSR